jgi:hypothetical protein
MSGEFHSDAGKFNIIVAVLTIVLAFISSSTSAIETICNTVLRALDKNALETLPGWLIVSVWIGTFCLIVICLGVILKMLVARETTSFPPSSANTTKGKLVNNMLWAVAGGGVVIVAVFIISKI